jgi:hypothetical protein
MVVGNVPQIVRVAKNLAVVVKTTNAKLAPLLHLLLFRRELSVALLQEQ